MHTILTKRWFLPWMVLCGFFLRLLFVPNPGFEADISFWKSWGLAPFDYGLVKGLSVTNNNYPTPFGYLLWAITAIYSLFANPHLFHEFWNNSNLLFLTLIKLPAILADLGIAVIILKFSQTVFAKHNTNTPGGTLLGTLLAALYLINPVSILDSAVWGQVDALGVFLFLIAIMCVIKKHPFIAGIFYMVALMTKLQTMIYGPLFFLVIWHHSGFDGLVKALGGSLLAFFGLNSEFLWQKQMGRVMTSLTTNYDYFPYLSLNAYNLWWIVAKGFGMSLSDKILTIGIINAKTLGLLLFTSSYLFAAGTIVWKHYKHDTDDTDLLHTGMTSLIIVAGSFFLFQTQSHDRYAFPIIVFLLLWIPLAIKQMTIVKERELAWKSKAMKTFSIGYILFSLLYFFNMHTALMINYPKNGLSLLSFLASPVATISIAYLLIASFILFLVVNRKTFVPTVTMITICFFVGSVIIINMPLLMKRPIALTTLTPFRAEQQYGVLTKHMPINAKQSNPTTWDRLSIQYFFYAKGLGTHATSTIVYDLNKRFTRFSTDMGVDTEAGPKASVVFQIFGDNTLLFQSDTKKRYDLPTHTDVDITGVSTLTLVVLDAQDGNIDDHADWVNPKLWP